MVTEMLDNDMEPESKRSKSFLHDMKSNCLQNFNTEMGALKICLQTALVNTKSVNDIRLERRYGQFLEEIGERIDACREAVSHVDLIEVNNSLIMSLNAQVARSEIITRSFAKILFLRKVRRDAEIVLFWVCFLGISVFSAWILL
jgi:hypothetical protein